MLQKLIKVINSVKLQYASAVQISDQPIGDISPNDIVFYINDQLFFERLLLEIRGTTISYASYLKRQRGKTEDNLLNDVAKILIMLF